MADVSLLQRSMGNRATSQLVRHHGGIGHARLLMRQTAEELLNALPDFAREQGRWNDALPQYVEGLQAEYNGLEIGSYKVTQIPAGAGPSATTRTIFTPGEDVLFQQFSEGILHARPGRFPTNVFVETPNGKLLAYLLGLTRPHPPGWGSFGILGIVKGQLEGRPGFAKKTLREKQVQYGQARRHITAWHNLRTLLNYVIGLNRFDMLSNLLEKAPIDKEVAAEGRDLLAGHITEQIAGGLRKEDAHNMLLAAYVMNSVQSNLWVGPSRENSEIATLSYTVQVYLSRYLQRINQPGNLDEFADSVASYNTHSEKASRVKQGLLTAISANLDNPNVIPEKTLGALEELEVDRATDGPQPDIHSDLFRFIFTGASSPNAQQLERLLFYYLTGVSPA